MAHIGYNSSDFSNKWTQRDSPPPVFAILYNEDIFNWFKTANRFLLPLGGVQPNTLQQATVQITSNAKCNELWSFTPSPVSNQHICASAAGKDTCQVSTSVKSFLVEAHS